MKSKEEIQAHLDSTVNTLLGQHRGRVEVSDVQDHNDTEEGGAHRAIYIIMVGGCKGCAGAKATIRTIITNEIKRFDPTIDKIRDITDHSDKTNAFFKE